MPQIKVAEKLLPILTTPKRVKIAVGGRGASKSIAFADCFAKFCSDGERLCCAREFQNLIEESVHPLICSRIEAIGAACNYNTTSVSSPAGGEIFYRGLSRNPTGIKSMFGVTRMWVEEAQSLSGGTLDALMPTIREDDSEIWMSMNRGSSKDPVSERFLKPYEKEVAKYGFYEDDEILIIEINWQDNPWFPDVLNKERLRDKRNLPAAKYDHIWNGRYSDTVENAIIEPEWFDACIDAHKVLGFEPLGQIRAAYDPADTGDAKAIAVCHGVVFTDVEETEQGRIDTATDWATTRAIEAGVDAFIWDADGIGGGLKRQVTDAFEGKNVEISMFHGGGKVDAPGVFYDRMDGEVKKAKTNKETFANLRAQRYWKLRDRMFRTYLAVLEHQKGHAIFASHDELISFDSGISDLQALRAEICRIPRKYVSSGRIQILSKPEMKSIGIDSPNLADAVMMAGEMIQVKEPVKQYEIPQAFRRTA